jgi:hypothetical protein
LHSACEIRITGGWVLHLVELAWKAAKIVDRPGRRADRDASSWYKPMSGNRQNGLRPGDLLADPPPPSRIAVRHDGIHRIAVPEENRGQCAWHAVLCLSVARSHSRFKIDRQGSTLLLSRIIAIALIHRGSECCRLVSRCDTPRDTASLCDRNHSLTQPPAIKLISAFYPRSAYSRLWRGASTKQEVMKILLAIDDSNYSVSRANCQAAGPPTAGFVVMALLVARR